MKTLFVGIMLSLILAAGHGGEDHVEQVTFESRGTKLAGAIVFPKQGEVRAAVVFVHGSGKQKRPLHVAERFAVDGIATLVYDKRGVGESGGVYEGKQSVGQKNIDLLAEDAAAAFRLLQAHPRTRDTPLGLTGISQAGWIVPIAAEKVRGLDFLVLWSAPVCKVSEEDIFSKYTADKDTDRVPSYAEALNARTQEYVWPDFLGKDSNPSDSLAKFKVPGLWIFGGKDGSVPVDLSMERLSRLIDAGHDYEYVLFSSLGHNNMGETFATATDWIKRLK